MADKIVILDETDKTSIESKITTHTSNKSNPHGVTLSQLSVTATAAELNVLDGITATTTELNYIDGVTSAIQTQLNAKVPTSRTINSKALSGNITLSASDVSAADRTLSNLSNKATALTNLGLTATATELNYVDGVTSSIQTQLNNKSASNHGHTNYALLVGSNEFDGEQKFTHAEYCPELNDTANGIGCAIKATRGLFNEMLADKLVITDTTKQMPIYAYSGTNNGSMANMNRVAYVDTSGNAVFNGSVSGSNLKDTVVEQGLSGNVYYQKWNSGKAEAWCSDSIGDVNFTTSFASGIYYDSRYKDRDVNIPSGIFNGAPIAFGNTKSNGYTHCQIASTSATKITYRMWASYNTSVTGCVTYVYMIGRWK